MCVAIQRTGALITTARMAASTRTSARKQTPTTRASRRRSYRRVAAAILTQDQSHTEKQRNITSTREMEFLMLSSLTRAAARMTAQSVVVKPNYTLITGQVVTQATYPVVTFSVT